MIIKEIKELNNAAVSGTFMISRLELKPFKHKEGSFMQCDLADKSGTVRGIVWEGAEQMHAVIKNKSVVEIKGNVTRYNDIPQVVIDKITEVKEYDLSLLVPSLEKDKIDSMFKELQNIGKTVTNKIYRSLWEWITDKYMSDDFKNCPGGVGTVHHAYLGGLLEHVYSMIKIAESYAKEQKLDRDLLITGCLIHDIGKIKAYNWKKIIEMNDAGRLLHHTNLGYGMVIFHFGVPQTSFYEMPEILKLLHIIISHHEDEGHRKPMFLEAVAVSQIDALDALVNHATDYIEKDENQDTESNWTKFCQLTERAYYHPGKKEEKDA